MLKSRYQAVFWGKTPWSLLHALMWRLKGQEVLVIDDQTLSTASGTHRWLTSVEVSELEALGEKFQIAPLMALDSFLRPARLKIHTPTRQWVTHGDGKDNLRELVRKFGVFQTPLLLEALEKADVAQDLRKLTRPFLEWFRSNQARQRSAPAYQPSGVPWFSEFQRLLGQELARPYSSGMRNELTHLVVAHYGVTGQAVKYDFSEHEATYLALRLLSPLWELDQRWFEREMLRELQAQGAHFKRAGIQSWQMGCERVEAALLDSYEGVVVHERLLMYGFPPVTGSLLCEFEEKVYRGLETVWPHAETSALEGPSSEVLVMTAEELMGTDIPLMIWQGTEEAAHLQVLVEEREAAKPEFYRKEAMEALRPLWQQGLGLKDLSGAKSTESWVIWLAEAPHETAGASDVRRRRSIKVVERESRLPVQGLQYWGPLMGQRGGLLGYLSELRWDLA